MTSASSAALIRPDWNAAPQPFRHTWEGWVNIDQFRWLVRRDTQEQLCLSIRELGARHVRAVGMFDDEMRFLTLGAAGWRDNPQRKSLDFHLIDYVMDSLLDLGLAPVFTTCFTPSDWARGEKTIFTTKSRVGLPKDLNVWAGAVAAAVKHAFARYGIATVKEWYFEVWNEPNLGGFFDGTREEFLQLWKATFDAIKSVDATLRVGGPSTARGEWLGELLEWAGKNGCPPDYLITHVYNNDSESGALSPFEGPQEERVNRSPNFASGVIRGARQLAHRLGFKGEIVWNEWGRTWHPTDPHRETPNEAAWLVKTMSEVSQHADAFAYWCLSDIYDQVGYTTSAFQGHYGMMNLYGLRKPSWHAHQLLSRLGSERVPCSWENSNGCDGVIVTRRGERSAQALLFSFADGAEIAPARKQLTLEIPASLAGLPVRITRLDSRNNNILVQWRELGSPDYLLREQVRDLRAVNELRSESAGGAFARNGMTVIELELESPGLLLVEVGEP